MACAHTYQYILHTGTLKDASEDRTTGQTVPGMLRLYTFVNIQTEKRCMYIDACTRTMRWMAEPAPYQRAAGTLSVLNELDHKKCSLFLFSWSQAHIQMHKKTYHKASSNAQHIHPVYTHNNKPALLSDRPSRLIEMDWSPSCWPRPRIIQFSRLSESEESHSDLDSDSSESDSELLESTVTGLVRLLFFWFPLMNKQQR